MIASPARKSVQSVALAIKPLIPISPRKNVFSGLVGNPNSKKGRAALRNKMQKLCNPQSADKFIPTNHPQANLVMAARSSVSVEIHRSHFAEDVLKVALQELGWSNASLMGRGKPCDIYWRRLDWLHFPLPAKSYIATIPGISSFAPKDQLSKHIQCLRTFFPDEFSFYPETWMLPDEQELFEDYGRAQKHKGRIPTFIVKPDEGSQDPPEVYLFRSGMARFCTMPYEKPSVKNLHQTFMHLTNYSLNKRSKDFVHTEDGQGGTKQTLDAVLTEIEALGHSKEEVWGRIEDLVCKIMIALMPQLLVERHNYMTQNSLTTPLKGYQLLGVDILLDHKLNPHLLEINTHPSLRTYFEQPIAPGKVEYVPSPVDMSIKLPVVKNTLKIIAAKIKKTDLSAPECVELLPCKLDTVSHLRTFERCSAIFNRFVGAKGGLKMGSTSFRTFARTCNLTRPGFTTADVDIVYIEMCRKHNSTYFSERNNLSFHGFCKTLIALAERLHGDSSLEKLEMFLTECEVYCN